MTIFHKDSFVGTFILFPTLVQPASYKNPFSSSAGFKNSTFFLSFKFFLCFLNEISSTRPPLKDNDPCMLSFSIFTLSEFKIESSLEIFFILIELSIVGVIEFSLCFSNLTF